MHSSTSGQFIRVNHIPRSQTKYLARVKNRLCTVCEARNTEQIYLFIYLNIYQFVGSSVCLAMCSRVKFLARQVESAVEKKEIRRE